MSSEKLLAVCMPAYNASTKIRESIDSILRQSFADFDFVITDDCSADDTANIVASIDDPRIILRRNNENLGGAATRNTMVDYCINQGYKYMAIMDADDIAMPDRLRKQVEILERDPSLAICGSSMKIERNNSVWVAPAHPASIKAECIFGNPIPTSTAIIRLRYLKELGLKWDTDFVPCADYHLWYEMLFVHGLRARNTGDIDMIYSYSPGGISHTDGQRRQELKDAEVKRLIFSTFNVETSSEEMYQFMRVALYRSDSVADAANFVRLSLALKQANLKSPLVHHRELMRRIAARASNFLGNTLGLDESISEQIKTELMLAAPTLLERLEAKLRAFKRGFLDHHAPTLSYRLTVIFKALRH